MALVSKTSVSADSTIGGLTMACRLSAALSLVGFGDPPAQAGARGMFATASESLLIGNQVLCSLRYIQSLKPKRTDTIGLLRPQDLTGGAFRNFRNSLSSIVCVK